MLGVLLLLVAWEISARCFSGLVIARPEDTLRALCRFLGDADFLTLHFLTSVKRVALSLTLGIAAGGSLGLLAGLAPPVRGLLDPLRRLLLSAPGVVIVMVFMLWFGMGSTMVVSLTTVMIAPIIYVNVVEGMLSVDRSLLEMARVYRFPLRLRLVGVYCAALAGPFLSGVILATGNSIRVLVLAEVLGANDGLGYMLAISRTNLDTPSLYALALLSMGIVGAVELCLLRPVRLRILRRYP
jgi:NitT/TauT family transport system permease protein